MQLSTNGYVCDPRAISLRTYKARTYNAHDLILQPTIENLVTLCLSVDRASSTQRTHCTLYRHYLVEQANHSDPWVIQSQHN